jgi:hypothetical protein
LLRSQEENTMADEAKVEEAQPEVAEETKDSPKLEGKMAEFVDWIETISVLELSQLVTALEDRLGVSAAAPVAVAAAGAVPGGGGEGGGGSGRRSSRWRWRRGGG